MDHAYYPTPLGCIRISHDNGYVCGITLLPREESSGIASECSDLAAAQILAYLSGDRKAFDFPMKLLGPPFQLQVWHQLMQIPYGETRTYLDIAQAIGKPTACRAVGMACNRNPVWIAVPCHRVVGKNNTLTGYAGGLQLKQQLLELERT